MTPKACLSLLLLFVFSSLAQAQDSTYYFNFNNKDREYILHVPAIYDGSTEVPLVLALHGLGDSGANFRGIGMSLIADTANFLVAYPTALLDPLLGGAAWDNGLNPFYTEDDIGFLNALLDSVSLHFNVDQDRIYATGFSMGGFMSQLLGCDLSNRIAAVGSVSGTLANSVIGSCSPNRTVPILHFHGTEDSVIPYDGSPLIMNVSVDDDIAHWVAHNNCPTTPVVTQLPDLAADGYTVETHRYFPCQDNTEVLFYKVNGGAHTWLGSSNDVRATVEIWNFFSKYSKTDVTSAVEGINPDLGLTVAPNPFSSHLEVTIAPTSEDIRLSLFNALGQQVLGYEDVTDTFQIPTSHLPNGFYFLNVEMGDRMMVKKVVKSE